MRQDASRWRVPLVGLAALLPAACDSAPSAAPDPKLRIVSARPASPAPRVTPAPSPAPVATPATAPTPRSLADMHPRKTFTDPPLPAELRDDGGRLPLPPPPAPTR